MRLAILLAAALLGFVTAPPASAFSPWFANSVGSATQVLAVTGTGGSDAKLDVWERTAASPEALQVRLSSQALASLSVHVVPPTVTVSANYPGASAETVADTVAAHLGAVCFRTHDVRQTRRALDMVASISGGRPPVATRRGRQGNAR